MFMLLIFNSCLFNTKIMSVCHSTKFDVMIMVSNCNDIDCISFHNIVLEINIKLHEYLNIA